MPLAFLAFYTGLSVPLSGSDVACFVGPALDAQLGVVGTLEYEVADGIAIVADVPAYLDVWLPLFIVSTYPSVGIRFTL